MLRSGTCCVIEKLPQKLRRLISKKHNVAAGRQLLAVKVTEEAECTNPQMETLEVELLS